MKEALPAQSNQDLVFIGHNLADRYQNDPSQAEWARRLSAQVDEKSFRLHHFLEAACQQARFLEADQVGPYLADSNPVAGIIMCDQAPLPDAIDYFTTNVTSTLEHFEDLRTELAAEKNFTLSDGTKITLNRPFKATMQLPIVKTPYTEVYDITRRSLGFDPLWQQFREVQPEGTWQDFQQFLIDERGATLQMLPLSADARHDLEVDLSTRQRESLNITAKKTRDQKFNGQGLRRYVNRNVETLLASLQSSGIDEAPPLVMVAEQLTPKPLKEPAGFEADQSQRDRFAILKQFAPPPLDQQIPQLAEYPGQVIIPPELSSRAICTLVRAEVLRVAEPPKAAWEY